MPKNNQKRFLVFIYFIKALSWRVLCHMSKDNKNIFHFSFVFYVRDAVFSDVHVHMKLGNNASE